MEKPLYYSSDDEPGDDCLFYLPVAPDIDEPEGEVVPGYDQIKPPSSTSGKDKNVLTDTSNEVPTEDGPPKKKTKITDVAINGDIYDQSNVMAGMFVCSEWVPYR